MTYELLTQDDQDEVLASFLMAQERDSFCHQLNLARFNSMLSVLPEGKYKQHILQMRDDTQGRLAEVNAIIDATLPQLPTKARLQAAMQRVKEKEERSTPT